MLSLFSYIPFHNVTNFGHKTTVYDPVPGSIPSHTLNFVIVITVYVVDTILRLFCSSDFLIKTTH